MPKLVSPLKIKSVTLRNRIGVSPMCQYSSEDGFLNDWHLVHLGSRAVGGAALVIIEATAVSPMGRITAWDAGLWKDEQIDMIARIARFMKSQGAVPAIQLAHAGRKASTARPWEGGKTVALSDGGWETWAPSAIAFGGDITHTPHEMTVDEIRQVQNQFAEATHRALSAGIEWLELHAAHGYLIHSFYSPLSNKRTDEYGGSFENRIRMLVETTQVMRAIWPDHLPFAVRISATDWIEGGWSIEDSVALARILKQLGVDLIDCSSGFNTNDISTYPFGPGFQVPLSEAIRQQAGIATAAVGYITSPVQADEIIRNGRADLVLMAREFLREPYWPLHAAADIHAAESLQPPPQYGRAFRK